MTSHRSPAPGRRPLHRLLVSMLAGLVLLPFTAVAGAAPATAATDQFRGTNWAMLGDNFATGPLVLDGLSSSDSHATVQAKANAVYDDMAALLGTNTVRIPINTHTVGTTWWNAYRGVIDAATARGWKVIVAYWEDGAASGGRITNTSAFNTMWNTVVSQYGSNSLVYFEPMNEPHGYSSAEWRDVAASWMSARSSVPKGRILVGGTGYSQDLRDLCGDARFNGTLFSFHTYEFFYGDLTPSAWRTNITTRLGGCASRAVVTEFGAAMHTGLNYGDASSAAPSFVRYLRALTDIMREQDMGGTYWPALGGKYTGDLGYDGYSIFAKSGSGTNLNLTIRNASGANRYRWAFGDDVDPNAGNGSGSGTVTDIVNQASGKCVDIVSASTADAAEAVQYTCGGASNQQFALQNLGNGYYNIVAQHSGRCLDVNNASTADGAAVIQYTCGSGTNQQWELRAAGSSHQLVARHSGKCLDVPGSSTANGTRLKTYTCNTGTNQRWTL